MLKESGKSKIREIKVKSQELRRFVPAYTGALRELPVSLKSAKVARQKRNK